MKLPNAEHAVVEMAKLRDYSLNPAHEEGKHKARVFASALELHQEDAPWLKDMILKSSSRTNARLGRPPISESAT